MQFLFRSCEERVDLMMARTSLEEAYGMASKIDDQIDMGKISYWLAISDCAQQLDVVSVRTRLAGNVSEDSTRRAPVDVGMSKVLLGEIETAAGNISLGRSLVNQGIEILWRFDDNESNIRSALSSAIFPVLMAGDTEVTISLFTFLFSSRVGLDINQPSEDSVLYYLRPKIGETRYRKACDIGKRLSIDEAVEKVRSIFVSKLERNPSA